jgi:uncharacterized membrane protein required for colicin V production
LNAPLIFGLSVIVLFGALGWRDGVVKRVLEVAGAIAALLLTARFAGAVQPWVSDRTGAGTGPALLITWAVLFILGLILSRLLASLIAKLLHLTVLVWVDRLGGALLGLCFGLLVASVLLVAASQVRGGSAVQADCDRSFAGRTIFYAAPNMYLQARKLSGGRVEAAWEKFTTRAAEAAAAGKTRVKEAAARHEGS